MAALFSVAAACSLTTCTPSVTALEKVRMTGVLRVATVNSPTSYFVGPDGATGFDYDLASGFAKQLGVELRIEVVASAPDALELARLGKVDMAAAGLAVTPQREAMVSFSPPVRSVVPQLVYRMGQKRPKSWEELDGGRLAVPSRSAQTELLATRRKQYSGLKWEEVEEGDAEDLLEQVADGNLDYTLVNSDLVSINQRYYPKLRVAFAGAESQPLAWAFPKSHDNSLTQAAADYITGAGKLELARLQDRHFGHIEAVDHIGAVALATHMQTRLPAYRKSFEAAARKSKLDWRLLAAIAYQESHWDSAAVSPTGVRGIMQLTMQTALHLKVDDREDPLQSISGGARYIRGILNQLPEDIGEPDRTWLALSAYNMGTAHLNDARKLTQKLGGDPNRWLDVRNNLPLLTQPRWYRQTEHGYARGRQAMEFVSNVRTYYDMLVWLSESTSPPLQSAQAESTLLDEPTIPAGGAVAAEVAIPDPSEVLRIRAPIL
ncbi:membrane-bound lytic murein transglycosylase MltF [Hydrocarboniphaga effusa]|uniref:membrane-bound lytic murein transglycosylase MltF n=1 Tax=Hydrocarboniphaga effusa TaxID=243629 RepID=UPI003137A1EA